QQQQYRRHPPLSVKGSSGNTAVTRFSEHLRALSHPTVSFPNHPHLKSPGCLRDALDFRGVLEKAIPGLLLYLGHRGLYSCHLALRSSLFGIITAKTCAFSWPSGKLLLRSSATMTFHVDSGISIPLNPPCDPAPPAII